MEKKERHFLSFFHNVTPNNSEYIIFRECDKIYTLKGNCSFLHDRVTIENEQPRLLNETAQEVHTNQNLGKKPILLKFPEFKQNITKGQIQVTSFVSDTSPPQVCLTNICFLSSYQLIIIMIHFEMIINYVNDNKLCHGYN